MTSKSPSLPNGDDDERLDDDENELEDEKLDEEEQLDDEALSKMRNRSTQTTTVRNLKSYGCWKAGMGRRSWNGATQMNLKSYCSRKLLLLELDGADASDEQLEEQPLREDEEGCRGRKKVDEEGG